MDAFDRFYAQRLRSWMGCRAVDLTRTAVLAAALFLVAGARSEASDLRDVLTEYTVTSWGQRDGLPPGAIWSTAQDQEGYLWIGTDAGLYRFDGVRFIQWHPLGPTSLPPSVRVVQVSRDGSVWAGHGEAGGISRILAGEVRTYGEREGLPRGAISAIIEDSKGSVLAGSSQGLFSLAGERWERVVGRGMPDAPVFGAHLNARDDLTIGTGAGIYRRAAGSEEFARLDAEYEGIPRSFTEDAQGRLYVVDGVLGVREAGSGESANLPLSQRGRGYRLLHDRRGNLWVGTLGQGLWRMTAQQQSRRSGFDRLTALTGLAYDGVLSLSEDRDGNMWVGTSEGLSRLVLRQITQITNLGLVTGVDIDQDGHIWVGTVDELLRFSDSNLQTPLERVPLPSTRLRTMHTRGDTLWAATDSYLARRTGAGGRLSLLGTETLDRIDLMTTDVRGDLWLYDNQRRLRKWSNGRLQPIAVPAPFEGLRIVEIYGDRSGRVWTSWNDGSIGFVSDGHFSTFGANDGYEAGACRAFYEDRDGAVWIAGSVGLSRFLNGRFTTLSKRNGFPLDNLTAIIDDDEQNLWVGSSVGIMRLGRGEFDKALDSREYALQYTLYDRNDGIAGTPLDSYSTARPATRAGDGRLWFVTGLGLTVIDPQALAAPAAMRPVRIEQVTADETRLPAESGMALPPRTSRLQIDYTVVNLTSPFRTNFRYRLEGFDNGWIDAGTRRQAFYTNLPPRKYNFSLVASNSEGATLSTTTWDFSIAPTFYQTGWFYVASFTAFVLALGGAWYLYLRRVRRDFALLLGERTRLSREIHDTLLQSLVGVALQFEAIASDVETTSPQTKAQFVRMRKRVEEYIREARQSIWNLRSPRLERRDLAAALNEFGAQATATSGAGFELTLEGTPKPRPPVVEEQLLRIGQEAIMNAVRHARASSIKVELKYGEEALVLRVTDDGAGFNVEAQSSESSGHYGLISMKERAGEAGGTLKVASSADAGTQVTLVVPMSRQHWKPSHADA